MFITTPRHFFKTFCERHGIRYLNLHSMRHFNASAMISAGVDVKAVHDEFTSDILDSVASFEPIGGEMEGYGIYEAAHNENNPQSEVRFCALLKGICDWGMEKNSELLNKNHPNYKEKLQNLAASNACDVALELLQMKYIKQFGVTTNEDLNTIIHLENQVRDDAALFKAITCVQDDIEEINGILQRYKKNGCQHFIVDLRKHGYINASNNLTKKGEKLIYNIAVAERQESSKKQFEIFL